jgi:hypothetical protein
VWAAALTSWLLCVAGGTSPYFANGWKIVHSSPPRSNYIQSSAHSVDDDVVRGFDARDQAGEG